MNSKMGWIGLGSSLLVLGTVLSCGATGYGPREPAPAIGDQPDQPALSTEMDTLDLPQPTRTTATSDGRYSFTVQAERGWESDRVSGRLTRDSAVGTQRLWQHDLPHSYGPRFIVVGAQGQVLLLDEFINVASPYAVMLMDRQGDVIAQYSFDDIEAQLGIHRADIVEQAEYGWWMSAPPQVDEAAGTVTVAAAGKMLTIDLTSGQLDS
ncbi:MAG: hypothetical protein AAFU71_16405 [Cyanobacteria bacterium J06632_22]